MRMNAGQWVLVTSCSVIVLAGCEATWNGLNRLGLSRQNTWEIWSRCERQGVAPAGLGRCREGR